jgi:hypothetical protein
MDCASWDRVVILKLLSQAELEANRRSLGCGVRQTSVGNSATLPKHFGATREQALLAAIKPNQRLVGDGIYCPGQSCCGLGQNPVMDGK